jgi:hypothetical protein
MGFDASAEVSWIQSSRNSLSELRSLQLNPNGGPVLIGNGTAYAYGLTIKPAANDYTLTLLQSNVNNAGWGMYADTGGGFNLARYSGGVFSTACFTAALGGAISMTNGLAVTGTITATGNVGLAFGTLLTLNGNNTAASYALQAATAASPYDFRFIGSSDSGTTRNFSFGYYTGDSSANAWNPKVTINSYTGNVGIGTASPALKLDVSGQIRSNSNTLISLTAATATTVVSIDKVLETDTLANSIVMVTVSGSNGIDAGYNGYFLLNLNKNFSNYDVTVISSALPHNSTGYSFTFSLTSANFQVTAGKTTSFNYNYSVLTGSRTG